MVNILINKKKESYGPIMNSLIKEGVEVFDKDTTCITGDTICFENRPEAIPKVKVREGKLGWWMCDLRSPHNLGELANPVDAIFICNKQYLREYQHRYGVPTYYVPQCGLNEEYKIGRKIEWDVVFIGNIAFGEYHANRATFIEALQKRFNFKMIYGEGTTVDQRWIYKKTPISIAISPQFYGYASNRLYNILASGGFCLTLWYPGIEEQFVNHKHLVWFKDENELIELAGFYLREEGRRKKIAEAGHRLYQKEHTAKKRLEIMSNYLNICNSQTQQIKAD